MDGLADRDASSAATGLRVPFELAAIDAASYARFVPQPECERSTVSRDGQVVLGDGGAALRGITRTGSHLRTGDGALTRRPASSTTR